MSESSVAIRSSLVTSILAYAVIVLVALNVVGLILRFNFGHDYVTGFYPRFNLDMENNYPTYFSSLMLLTASCLLYAVSRVKKACSDKYAKHWTVLSIIFLYLSVDELSSIHELINSPLRDAFGFTGVLYFSWVVAGFVAVILMAAFYYRFVMALPHDTRARFFIAAILYVGGALGLELCGGYYSNNYGQSTFAYGLIMTVEETLEMIGMVVFINALLKYLSLTGSNIRIEFRE